MGKLLPSGILLFTSTLAWASNYHEHYSSLVNYEDYDHAFKTMGMELGQLKLGPLPGYLGLTEDCSEVFHQVFDIQISKEECTHFTLHEAANHALKSLKVTKSPAQIEEAKRAFFEFNALNKHNPKSMDAIGWNVRTQTQKYLAQLDGPDGKSGLYSLFKNYLKNRAQEDREVITLSIGASAYRGEKNRKALKELKELFQKYGTRAEFFLVWQRNKLILDSKNNNTSEYENLIDQLEGKATGEFSSALSAGLVDGFDLVGSLHEGNDLQTKFKTSEATPTSEELKKIRSGVEAQLNRMFQLFNSHPELQLKLHAWEKPSSGHSHSGSNDHYDGEFYKALKSSLKNSIEKKTHSENQPQNQRQIRIGHIGGIDPNRDISYFESLRDTQNVKLIFEANIQSSIANHEVKIEELIKTLERLNKSGFEIILGTDGAGIIKNKDAHFSETIQFLKENHLSESALENIVFSTQKYVQGFHQKTDFTITDLNQTLNRKLNLENNPCIKRKRPCTSTPIYTLNKKYQGCSIIKNKKTRFEPAQKMDENSCKNLCDPIGSQ